MTRYSTREAELRARAAEYAAALLVERPELCRDELQSLADAMDAVLKNLEPGASAAFFLVGRLDAILERDDEDTDETARLIFGALAK